jgi:hypothetical protein
MPKPGILSFAVFIAGFGAGKKRPCAISRELLTSKEIVVE